MRTTNWLITTVLAIFFCCSNAANAQISSVNYQMKYDTSTCLYDCYLIVNSGNTTTVAHRIQFNAQYTIAVPTGTTITVDSLYNPLVANANEDSTTPAQWTLATSHDYAPTSTTFHSIVPTIQPQAHYNTLNSGDTVKLFSLGISPTVNCAQDIKIFENGVDPNSSDPDMSGLDFSNGFTTGSTSQLYAANSTQVYPPTPIILSTNTYCDEGIEIDLTAETSTCQAPLTYQWTGPDSYSSTNEDVNINPVTPANTGDYKVVLTDGFGCVDSVTITATAKPNAGNDATVCAGIIDTLRGLNPNSGTWAQAAGNPSGASLIQIGSGEAQYTLTNAASGTFEFVYSTTGCTDTMVMTVNPLPVVSITGDTEICVLTTTTISPTTGGTWTSSNTSVATVTNAGVVTAVGSGTATFTFVNTLSGCENTTPPITVNPAPTVTNTGQDTLCIAGTTNLTPATGGTWTSSDGGIATITNSGLVTAIAEGSVYMLFNETSTNCQSDTIFIEVRAKPIANITGEDTICILGTTNLTPATGGTWVSSNNLIAAVNNSGLVTGLDVGTVTFTFTETSTQCASDPSDTIWVVDKPTVAITGDDRICIGSTTMVSPTSGGTWTSSNTAVLTVTDAGVVTAVSQGSGKLTFTDTITGCFAMTPAIVVDPKPTVSVTQSNICIGASAFLSPNSGGTWTAHESSIGSLTLGNKVTGIAEGTAKFTFQEQGTDCVSDTVFIVVEPAPVVAITGDDEICVGFTTQLSPTTGGTWASSDNNIATVSNSGLVTGVAAGNATFTYTSITTNCISSPTDPVTVLSPPIVTLDLTDICEDGTANLTPTTGGTWVSSNTSVATVTNAGVVSGVAPGVVTFTFTNTTTTCVSEATDALTVSENPTGTFNGPDEICENATTNVTPASGGTWVSSNIGVATVTNTGVVTGVSAGMATLTYTETSTDCSAPPITVTVFGAAVVSVTGDSPICVGDTSYLAPTTGGTWVTNNPGVASVNNSGLVIGLSNGTSTFYFQNAAGCNSDNTEGIIVNAGPTVTITGDDDLCIGDTTTLEPITGNWSSDNPTIVNILTMGRVVALANGVVTFSYQDTLTGCASENNTDPVTINPAPAINLNGPNTICVGSTTNISPTIGGSWLSTDPSVATVSNTGLITGIAAGTARFIYTDAVTGCLSDTSGVVTVTPGPIVSITGVDTLCIDETSTLSPTSGGTWLSSNTSVATVTDGGVVTAVGAGSATFTFTETGTGCTSEATDPIIVNGKPTVSVDGSDAICIGGTTNLLPNTGGTWASSNVAIATVTDAGLVTGITEGTVTFIFTLTESGCPSDPTEPVEVTPSPIAMIDGPTEICISGITTLSPSTGGTWTSSNTAIAIVTNTGIVTGIGAGKVTFNFTETATGCSSASSTGELTISNCSNPDFNETFVDVIVYGDVNTNDNVDGSTTYGPNPVLTSSPSGSIPQLNLNSDGTYSFEGNLVGVYTWNVQVCQPPQTTGCPVSLLTITVVDHLEPNLRPIANTDIAVTEKDSSVVIGSLDNDRCVVVTGCSLDATSVTITENPSNGTVSNVAANGDVTYLPNPGFLGKDTLTYQVCVTGEPGNCATAIQIITILDPSSNNSTDAADDFAVTAELTPVSGNVKDNDTDAEGDDQDVTAQNVTVAAGNLVLAIDGSYTFTPAEDFFGPVDFVYTTCDDNVIQACTDATLHILVVPDLSIKIRVYLEGSLLNNANTVGTTHTRPLMRDNLRTSPFNGSTYIPQDDPYQVNIIDEGFTDTYNTYLTNNYTHLDPGYRTEFLSIPSPTAVFAVTGEDAITDWVYVELRSKADNTVVLYTRSGFVQRDGDVTDLNGSRGLRFPDVAIDDYYVVVRHRNHLGAATLNAQTPKQLAELVDFTDPAVPVFDYGIVDYGGGVSFDFTGLAMKNNAKSGFRGLWAGDFDGNKKIKASNPGDDLNVVFNDVFIHPNNTTFKANFDFAYGYRNADFDMNAKVKFDNPNDDKNMLFGQLLFYPLNVQFLSNFDFFIEQIPE